jgi:hypothetical protein
MVAGTVSSRYEALRGRDRRRAVREPDEQSVASPVERKPWTKATRKLDSVGVSSGAQGVVGDSREIFGKRPETRRGLGVFRR